MMLSWEHDDVVNGADSQNDAGLRRACHIISWGRAKVGLSHESYHGAIKVSPRPDIDAGRVVRL